MTAARNPSDFVKTKPLDPDAPPPVLLGYQQRWVADPAQLKIAEKSRRIGLTWAEAADDVSIASAEHGSNVFYISASQDMAIEYIEACSMWAQAFDMAAGEIEEGVFIDGDKEIKTFRIDLPRARHRIVALSSRPANLRGKQGVIVIDEAAFAPDLAGLIKAAMAMLMWGDKVRILSTHDGDANPFNELIQEVREGRRPGSIHRIPFADAVADGLYERVCMRRRIAWTEEGEAKWVADVRSYYSDDAAEELDVIPSQGGGVYFPIALIESRMRADTPIVRRRFSAEFGLLPEAVRRAEVAAWCKEELGPILARLDKSERHSLGRDIARVGDLTVDVLLAESHNLVKRCRLVIELANCPFKQQEQIFYFVADKVPRRNVMAIDATGIGATLAEYAAGRYGAHSVEQVKLSDAFYSEQMPRLKAAFEDGTIDDIPRDRETRDDLRAVRKIDGVPKLPHVKTQVADGPQLQRHGDSAVAVMLAHYAASLKSVEIDFTAAPDKASRWNESADDDDFSVAMKGGW